MYFDLTKKEYKDYDKKFRKTYVGKKIYVVYILTLVLFCLMSVSILTLDIFSNGYKSIIDYIIPTCFLGIVSLVLVVHYEKLYYLELKDYIKLQKK